MILQLNKESERQEMERQDVSCMYLAHHQLESVFIIIITTVNILTITIIHSPYHYYKQSYRQGCGCAGPSSCAAGAKDRQ